PPRLAVIGAGPVGCELAQAFARFGARVSLLGNGPQIMPREDPDAAGIVEKQMRRDGVNLVLGCNVVRVAREGAERVLHLECGGRPMEVRADAILVGVGRAPNVQGLGLEAAGVIGALAVVLFSHLLFALGLSGKLGVKEPISFKSPDVYRPLFWGGLWGIPFGFLIDAAWTHLYLLGFLYFLAPVAACFCFSCR